MKTRDTKLRLISRKPVPFDDLNEIYQSYTLYLNSLDLSDKTIYGKLYNVAGFLNYLNKSLVLDISKLSSPDIQNYINSLSRYADTSKETILYNLRLFLRFLSEKGYNANHLDNMLRSIPSYKLDTLPCFY